MAKFEFNVIFTPREGADARIAEIERRAMSSDEIHEAFGSSQSYMSLDFLAIDRHPCFLLLGETASEIVLPATRFRTEGHP